MTLTYLATSVFELPDYASELARQGQEPDPGGYQCPGCPRIIPAQDARDTTGLPGELPRWVCSTCASGPLREAHQVVFELARALAGPDWSAARARRNLLLGQTDGRLAGDRPLSDELRAALVDYRQWLRDLPELYAHPAEIDWRDPPA